MDTLDLKKKAVELRKRTWELIYNHKNGHTGSDLSCTDILVALYYSVMNQNKDNFGQKDVDTYIQSKGHAVEIWYEVLADKGYIDRDDLEKDTPLLTVHILVTQLLMLKGWNSTLVH